MVLEMTKEEVKNKLLAMNRPGMDKVVQYMEENDFFISPSSTKYHGSCHGGLLKHSLSLYEQYMKNCSDIPEETIFFVAIVHDICKAGMYINTPAGYKYNQNHPKGHCLLSLRILEKNIELTSFERDLIKFHMGYYGTYEFAGQEKGEYTLLELSNAQKNKYVKLFYFCDDYSAQFLED